MFEILSDKEILKASQVDMFLPDGRLDLDCGYLRGRQQVAKAEQKHTLKQVYDRGKEICPHQSSNVNQPKLRLHYRQDVLRNECYICWAELEKEIEKCGSD